MARNLRLGPRGERMRMGVPYGHRKTTTLVAACAFTSSWRRFMLDGALDLLRGLVEHALVLEMRLGEIVMDNLPPSAYHSIQLR